MTSQIHTFVAHGPEGTIRRAVPHGWEKSGETDFSKRPIMRCLSDVCRAWVTDPDRAEQHDREFHLMIVGPLVDGRQTIRLDGIDAGFVALTRRGWEVFMPSRGALFDPLTICVDKFDDALAEAGRVHPLAKWWSEGLHTSTWQPVRP